MFIIKAVAAGLVCISFCMADISGIVTDTSGITPIPGASVRIETGNANTTAGADGRFTLVTTVKNVRVGTGRLLPGGLWARISGNVITVALAQKSRVEVAMFDLSGKEFSTLCKTWDAGSHSMVLPYRGAGISLYRVKSDNYEIVLKGNTAGGFLSSGSSASPGLGKQVLTAATIVDIINVTKKGYIQYRCVHYSDDTTGMVIKMMPSFGPVSDINGNEYNTVKIGNQVWMAENFRATMYNDSTPIPLDSVKSTWNADTTPKYCSYRNGTLKTKSGALYNWHVISPANPKRLAPAGWHVPTDADWNALESYLISAGYNWDGAATGNTIAKSIAAKVEWKIDANTPGSCAFEQATNNRTGFTGYSAGFRQLDGNYNNQGETAIWWSASELDPQKAYTRMLSNNLDHLYRSDTGSEKNWGFAVRLVKD